MFSSSRSKNDEADGRGRHFWREEEADGSAAVGGSLSERVHLRG